MIKFNLVKWLPLIGAVSCGAATLLLGCWWLAVPAFIVGGLAGVGAGFFIDNPFAR